MSNKSILISVIVILAIAAGAVWYIRSSAPDGETLGAEQALGACYIGGCSSEVCSDQPNVSSSCEFKQEYACYKGAKCERQTAGNCDWTMDSGLVTCLEVAIDGGMDLK